MLSEPRRPVVEGAVIARVVGVVVDGVELVALAGRVRVLGDILTAQQLARVRADGRPGEGELFRGIDDAGFSLAARTSEAMDFK
jgi:hypothetical protein